MKYLYLALLLMLTTACASGFNTKDIKSIDPRLEVYVTTFEKIYGIEVNYTVMIGPLNKPVNGMCSVRNGSRTITIDTVYYEKNHKDYYAMEQVMFHEMGHCSLNLGHNEELDSEGMPVSIMWPYTFSSYWYHEYVDYYEMNREAYLKELVNR